MRKSREGEGVSRGSMDNRIVPWGFWGFGGGLWGWGLHDGKRG